MNKLILGVFAVFCAMLSKGVCQSTGESQKIEALIASVVDKAMASSVYIIEYDTLTNKVKEGLLESDGFSGVVVSAVGHILTVSHAAATHEVYQVRFPDGSRHIAVGLGRLGIAVEGKDHDMAMLKILKPGNWPYVEMGRVSDLRLGQPLISIAYPGAFYKQLPNVRYGRLTDLDISDGFIESTVKMEPGDSGGPLFDALGRVVGIHSWIKESEEDNMDVPIDFFLKYWTAMNVAKDYEQLPGSDPIPAIAAVDIQPIAALDEVVQLAAPRQKQVVQVVSSRGAEQVTILGTPIEFVSARGVTFCVVSKSSMVADQPMLKLAGRSVPAEIIARDRTHDLVLLKTSTSLPSALRLSYDDAIKPELGKKDLGKILISVVGEGITKAGVLSAGHLEVPLQSSIGYIGASAVYADGKITFPRIGRGSPVAELLQSQDQVLKINGIAVKDAAAYNGEMQKYLAGDLIHLDILRGEDPVQVSVYLSGQPTRKHVSFEYPGGRSGRSDGFQQVFVHDAAVSADECGGAVWDIHGEFYGINIVRRSRTATLVLPKSVILQMLIEHMG